MYWFYDYGWFTGSLLGAVLYYVMSLMLTPAGQAVQATAMDMERHL